MKTDRYYTALTIVLILILAVALRLTAVASINSGKSPVGEMNNRHETELAMNVEFNFEEEAYINDIPFSTECVSAICKYKKAVSEDFEMPEESYVNDIPFDTEEISAELKYQKAAELNFGFDDEAYIDDIPFETYTITQVYLQGHFALGN